MGLVLGMRLHKGVKVFLTPMAMKSSTCMEGGRLVFCFLMRKMSFLPIARRCSIAGGGEGRRKGRREGGRDKMVSQYALRLHLHSQVLYLLLVFSEPQEQSDVTSVSWREKEEEEVERGGIVS